MANFKGTNGYKFYKLKPKNYLKSDDQYDEM